MTDTPGWASPDPNAPSGADQPHAGQPQPPPPPRYYGQPPGWTPPPPPRYQAPPKPGVIPLHPLSLTDILDGAITTLRRHPKLMLGMSAVVVTITELLAFPLLSIMQRDLDRIEAGEVITEDQAVALLSSTVGSLAITTVITVLGTVFLSGFLTVVVGKAVLGQPAPFAEVWTRLRPRLLPLLGLTLIFLLAAMVIAAPAVLMIVVGSPLLAVLLLLAAIVVMVWAYILYSLSTPALVLEHAGVVDSLKRSKALVTGAWWRVFGVWLLASIIAGILALIISVPFSIAGGAFDLGGGELTTRYLVLTTIGAIIAGTITQPFTAAVTVLQYTDQRIRREGMDIELARQAGTETAG